MKLLYVGHGRCGKDAALEISARISTLTSAGTFSRYLTPHVAAELGVDEAVAYAERHLHRLTWMRVGNALRADDPTLLCRTAFAHGDMSGGVRGLPEIVAIREQKLADLIVWIDRDVPPDPTLEFDSSFADVRIDNNGSLADFERRLSRLLGALGVLR